ncbi:hypothetical protein FSW04_11820 [Baekduia soli]|uniref:Uncharacterized protein n=1 Tax=Baekduia soli TaxID=496014 RepID=A0A5B8U4Z2_9ACTN|nr:DUF6636 domain-containing protein [Baekduia soli]QEC48186.1 hypothetical protein FSW04_11820 [Baekduia soli]
MTARTRRLAACVLAGLAVVVPAASAKDSFVAFRTPSGSIGCIYSLVGGVRALRCDVRGVVDPPARPKSCDLDYGSAFLLGTTGRARRLCAGDTALDPKANVLAYGHQRRLGPFTCTSRRTGLRCATHAGHGFELSRQAQRLF